MSIFVWSLLFTVFLCDIAVSVPTGEFRIGTDLADLTIFREKQKLLSTHLSEFTIWTRNTLTMVRSAAKAIDRAISEEFGTNLKQSTQTLTNNFLWRLQNFCVQLQEYIDVMKMALPPAPPEQSKEFPEVYIYRSVFSVLKTTFATLRSLAGQILESYSYYVPEITLTRCVGRYFTNVYPEWISRSIIAYPIQFMTYAYEWMMDIVKSFDIRKTTLAVEHKRNRHQNQNLYVSREGWPKRSNKVDSNEILKTLPWRYRRSNRESSNLEQYVAALFNFDDVIAEQLGWADEETNRERITSPTKCIQVYAVEALWDRFGKYLIH